MDDFIWLDFLCFEELSIFKWIVSILARKFLNTCVLEELKIYKKTEKKSLEQFYAK